MRIISKFRDYYDSVQMYGQDQSVLYIRKSELMKNEDVHSFLDASFHQQVAATDDSKKYVWESMNPIDGFFRNSFVVFVGDTYVKGMKLQKEYTQGGILKTKTEFAYSLADVDAFVLCEQFTEKEINKYLGLEKQWKYRFMDKERPYFCQKYVKEFFETKMQKNLCIDLRCPIVFWGDAKSVGLTDTDEISVVKSPCLNTLQLYKALPHGLAFQKIESFISGVLPGRYPEMIEVSEKTRLAKRGFDKWSFRKMPTKKK